MVGSVRLPSGPMQLSARAMMRAVVVLPTPRTPVSMKAWAMRPRGEGVGQGAHQRLLPDQAGEVGRAVFARQNAVRLGRRAQIKGQVFGHGGTIARAAQTGAGNCAKYVERWKPARPEQIRYGVRAAKACRPLLFALTVPDLTGYRWKPA